MRQIEISVKNKIACLVDDEQYLVCGNNDYEVVFNFDEQWSGVNAKTALFVFGSEPISVPFEGNVCQGVAVEGATLCGIGVFAGNLKTTTGAYIKCIPSIRDNGGIPKPPTPEVYDKIMEMLDKAIQAHTELPTGGQKGQVLKKKSNADYDTEWSDTVQTLTEIDKAVWKADGVTREWMDTVIPASKFPYQKERYDGVQFKKSANNGYAYDFDKAFTRVYVKYAGSDTCSKMPLSMYPDIIPDPDYKDWKTDENGIPISPQSFLNSIPNRKSGGHICVPNTLSAYTRSSEDESIKKMYAMSYGATKEYVESKINDLVNGAPEQLNTLNELAEALANDANFATTVIAELGNKVDKIEGKGLSANDYTTQEKEKLASIEIDQAYDFTSANAQSGRAVAEAIDEAKEYVVPVMSIIDQNRVDAGNPIDEEAYNNLKQNFSRVYTERNRDRGLYNKTCLTDSGEPDSLPRNFDEGETDWILESIPRRLGSSYGDALVGHIMVREDLTETGTYAKRCATPKKYVDGRIDEANKYTLEKFNEANKYTDGRIDEVKGYVDENNVDLNKTLLVMAPYNKYITTTKIATKSHSPLIFADVDAGNSYNYVRSEVVLEYTYTQIASGIEISLSGYETDGDYYTFVGKLIMRGDDYAVFRYQQYQPDIGGYLTEDVIIPDDLIPKSNEKVKVTIEWYGSNYNQIDKIHGRLYCYINDTLAVDVAHSYQYSFLIPTTTIACSNEYEGTVSIYNAAINSGETKEDTTCAYINFDDINADEDIPIWEPQNIIGTDTIKETRWNVFSLYRSTSQVVNVGYLDNKLGKVSGACLGYDTSKGTIEERLAALEKAFNL